MSTIENTKLNVTKRNRATIKRVVKATNEAKRNTKQTAFVSAAAVMKQLGVTNMKSGRALLRAHSIERTTAAITAFFKARKHS